MRLFIAVNFSVETCVRLIRLQDALRAVATRGRFTTPENLHLTLVFLGSCTPAQTLAAQAVMDAVAFSPFPIAIDRLGRFLREGGDIWWAGVQSPEPLMFLQRDLADRLRIAGFQLEDRPFHPHITLGRDIIAPMPTKTVSPFGETVCNISLMESSYTAGKLIYTPIYSVLSNTPEA
ncbi:MAG: RNA 2',3'-cyclic phosphodiesterase [Oscillospiraceae bacterium]|nr:RNA 2',3'-cyclic phosphodiesterase [Oscillospiraceae bacterium]